MLCRCGCGQPTKIPTETRSERGEFRSQPKAYIPWHERFWRKVRKGEGQDCWEWLGPRNYRGYGQVWVTKVSGLNTGTRGTSAHRVAYLLLTGRIPAGLFVLHRCDNRLCVRPDHLFLGTALDNSRDMVAKGRSQHGERHTSAKLTAAQVREIRSLYAAGVASQSKLGSWYGVKQHAVSALVTRQTWRDV